MSTETLRTVRLYGKMGSTFGRKFRLAVSSPAEAIRALSAMLPGFDAYLTGAKDNGFGFSIFVGKSNVEEGQLSTTYGNDDIRIAPILFGSKKAGVFNIILGAVLIVAGAYAAGAGFYGLADAMGNMGLAMIMGGVAALLTPTPKTEGTGDKGDDAASYMFNGSVNTQAQGNPAPLLYGRLIVGSAVISAGIQSEDVYIPTPSTGPGSGFSGGTNDGNWTDRDVSVIA